ncbi:hypothetical protein CAPTEDRAFT_122487 [Capitella teleta]|uniref:Uncharacterized protein n=1 Tax=Capitella teleta TaxID=283909 RepID=R7USD3_CAPTE|nr:hypothetical protein CAPTEDRAFT_122487 [Capitella teleta]|eukprot:ELU06321.1 hypothetical protein CAPTEDRAFT_122487 [Capitella teleta]
MENQLHWADYVIMAVLLGISLAIGVYHSLTGGRQRTTSEFILANRKLMVIPTIMSMVMSYMSAIIIIGATAEIYEYGSMILVWFVPGDFIGCTFLALVIIPWIYPLKLVSIFDGGMRAVVWTDFFQGVVLIAGILAVQIKGLILVGGFGGVIQEAEEHGRLILDEVNPDPRIRNSVLSLTLNSVMMVIFMKGFCQASVQRYSATQSLWAARKSVERWKTNIII